MADDVTLVPVSPFYRLHWIDGTHFEYSNDDAALTGEIVKLDPGDVAGYRRFLDYSRDAYEEGYGKLGHVAFDLRSMARAAPALARHQARSEEHTSELQSLMRTSYAVFCLKKKTNNSN